MCTATKESINKQIWPQQICPLIFYYTISIDTVVITDFMIILLVVIPFVVKNKKESLWSKNKVKKCNGED